MSDFKKHTLTDCIGLQIDNFVYNQHGELHRIGINDFSKFRHPNMALDFGLYGIPLTDQWLDKFGFKHGIGHLILIDGEMFKMGGVTLEVSFNDTNRWYIGCRNFNEGVPDDLVFMRNDLAYVHQLQNIYYAMSGKELKLINNDKS